MFWLAGHTGLVFDIGAAQPTDNRRAAGERVQQAAARIGVGRVSIEGGTTENCKVRGCARCAAFAARRLTRGQAHDLESSTRKLSLKREGCALWFEVRFRLYSI